MQDPAEGLSQHVDLLRRDVTEEVLPDASKVHGGGLAKRAVLGYEFDTLVAGHLTRLGMREDVEVQRDYIRDVRTACESALRSINWMDVANDVGWDNLWVVFDAYLDRLAEAAAAEVTPKWLGKLAAVDVFTEDHCWGHGGESPHRCRHGAGHERNGRERPRVGLRSIAVRLALSGAGGGGSRDRSGRSGVPGGTGGGPPLGRLFDPPERAAHGVFPDRRDAVPPGAAEGPQIGPELTSVGQARARLRLLERELLDHVRNRPPDQAEPDPFGTLENHPLDRDRDVSPDGRAVGGEHHPGRALEDLDVAAELLRRAGRIRRRGHVEDHVSRGSHHDVHRSERPNGAAPAEVERQLAAHGSPDRDRRPGREGPNGAQQCPAGRPAETRHAAQIDSSSPLVEERTRQDGPAPDSFTVALEQVPSSRG